MTPSDEDIRASDPTNAFLVDMEVAMNWTRGRQLNLQVSSFQITLLIDFENILLPNDLIIVTNYGDNDEDSRDSFGGMEDQQEHPI
jgi:hypothetical protein